MRNLLRHPATIEEIVTCLRTEAEAAERRSDAELSAGDMSAYLLRKAADIVESVPSVKFELRELEDQVETLRAALLPFVTFGEDNVCEFGWSSNIHRESISTWFGPSDFLHALSAVSKKDVDSEKGIQAEFARGAEQVHD